MNNGVELLESLIDESVQSVLLKSKTSEESYKNINKHGNCTKYRIKKIRANYKKD